jgi:hypothetical protein
MDPLPSLSQQGEGLSPRYPHIEPPCSTCLVKVYAPLAPLAGPCLLPCCVCVFTVRCPGWVWV